MESKKSLRRQAEKAREVAKEMRERLWHAEWALTGAETVLDNLGYEPVDVQHPVFDRAERDWRLNEAQSAKNAARDAELAEHLATQKATAREEGRREALALVIEALEIPGYRTDPFVGLLESPSRDHLERFHGDLTTAVEVRRDIAAATECGKVEKKVSELLKPCEAAHFVRQGETIASKADLAAGGLIGVGNSRVEGVTKNTSHVAPDAFWFESAKQPVDHDVATAGEKLEDAA